MEYTTTSTVSREAQGVEEAGCKIYSGAPKVNQTRGRYEEQDRLATIGYWLTRFEEKEMEVNQSARQEDSKNKERWKWKRKGGHG